MRRRQLAAFPIADFFPPSNSTEYVALVGSFFLVGLEAFIRIFTLALREPPPELHRPTKSSV
jgi:hypothetical protein